MFGVYYNQYDQELELYKMFSDGSQRRIAKLYMKNDFIHMDVRSNNFQYIPELENDFKLFSRNMIGVELYILYLDLLSEGMKKLSFN